MYLHPPTLCMYHTQGPPLTTSYHPSTSGVLSTSYNQYGPPQNNPYYPFSGPPQPVSPPHGQQQERVNFIQPSPLQQVQMFEQLNTSNPPHQSNKNRRKGKNKN
jgi:hypothetical protein